MASSSALYPDHLNPFGDDEEEEEAKVEGSAVPKKDATDDYPDHLDPFGDGSSPSVEDYDDSMNPFGDTGTDTAHPGIINDRSGYQKVDDDEKNPFADDIKQELGQQQDVAEQKNAPNIIEQAPDASMTHSIDSLEPPKPLPRTKSLLKKEQNKKRLQELQQSSSELNNHVHSIKSTTSSVTSSSSNSTTKTDNGQTTSTVILFQRRKNKRLAPPVPVNFKRQVSGSLDAIEEELNEIGDKLAIIDKESSICQKTLLNPEETDELDLTTTKSKFIELIKRRNSIVRRQKELMYTKRELKLDQLHSDIEYELRMIGNKQLSSRTLEDEAKEKELLKKLVEIVEEKNDIVENLNKDLSCDNHDIEEAFKRLNIIDYVPEKVDRTPDKNVPAKISGKGDNCDKTSLAKLSKIATLLPKTNTLKLKRKKLFKKNCDPKSIER